MQPQTAGQGKFVDLL